MCIPIMYIHTYIHKHIEKYNRVERDIKKKKKAKSVKKIRRVRIYIHIVHLFYNSTHISQMLLHIFNVMYIYKTILWFIHLFYFQ